MNTHTAIKVDGLSKCYRIGLKENMHDNFAGAVIDFLKKPVTNYYKYRSLYRFDDIAARGADIDKAGVIWALRDVNFEVQKGQVLGIIGRNGAGKSTLLKILSRITEPTHGQAAIRGKVSSLLEVGTGFHPELTGRENIYLNGSVLGMKKKDIDAQYDEIVDFSGIEKFIDTPIKRYSSGMKVRLAFAVAAHLKPEVLVIDEVLAVGDAAFQKKCLGKMHDITTEGRTVLFVSHNMGAIMQLCPKSLLLSDGTVTDYGPSKDVVENYLSQVFTKIEDEDLTKVQRREGDGRLRFTSAQVRSAGGAATSIPIAGEDMEVVLNYQAKEPLSKVRFVLTIFNQMGIAVTNCSVEAQGDYYDVPGGSGSAVCRIERLPLPLGQYKISIAAFDDIGRLDQVRTACVFDIEACKFYETAFSPPIRFSTALVDHSWRLEKGNGNKRLSETAVGNDSII